MNRATRSAVPALALVLLAGCGGTGEPVAVPSSPHPTPERTYRTIEVTGEIIVQRKPGSASVGCEPADTSVVPGSAVEVRDTTGSTLGQGSVDGDSASVTGEDINGDLVDDTCHLPFTVRDVPLSAGQYVLWAGGQESEPVSESDLETGINFNIGKPTAVPSPKPPAGTIPGDGTFLVPSEARPGTYRSTVGDGCYWARLSGTGGELDDIIANDNPSGPAIVTIRSTDKAFESRGCGEWRRI